jgi:hypothetical protein
LGEVWEPDERVHHWAHSKYRIKPEAICGGPIPPLADAGGKNKRVFLIFLVGMTTTRSLTRGLLLLPAQAPVRTGLAWGTPVLGVSKGLRVETLVGRWFMSLVFRMQFGATHQTPLSRFGVAIKYK